MTSNYFCKNCKYMETDQLSDMVCTNPKSLLYHQYINNVENHPFDIYEYPDARNIT